MSYHNNAPSKQPRDDWMDEFIDLDQGENQDELLTKDEIHEYFHDCMDWAEENEVESEGFSLLVDTVKSYYHYINYQQEENY